MFTWMVSFLSFLKFENISVLGKGGAHGVPLLWQQTALADDV